MTTAPPGWYPRPGPGWGLAVLGRAAGTGRETRAHSLPTRIGTTATLDPAEKWRARGLHRRMVALVLAAFVASQIAGIAFSAFSDMMPLRDSGEDTDWSTQPLEIVADSEKRACVLNVSAVTPGQHETHVIAVGTPAQVLIKDPTGEVVLQASDEADSKTEAAPSVQLREMGTYRVECHNKGRATTTAQLTVTSADKAADWSN